MNIPVVQTRSFAEPKGIPGKVIQFPLVRMLIGIIFVVVPIMLLKELFDLMFDATAEPVISYLRDAFAIVRMGVVIYSYSLFVRFIEKRKTLEMSASGSVGETALGFALGAVIMTFMVGLLWVLSYYSVESAGPISVIVHALFFFGFLAFVEEVVFRLIIFRHVEELAGSWGAIVITGALFGLAHFGNPNATAWSSAAIAMESVIIAGCFVLTRRVWLVWGLHAGWNYFQSAIYGVAVSGDSELESVLVPKISGPEWLTGGSFGVEASYVTAVLCLVIGVLLVIKASRAGQLVGPLWVRKMKARMVMADDTGQQTAS